MLLHVNPGGCDVFILENLRKFQRVIHSNCSTPRGQGFVFGRLGFAIQKGLAAQLIARLPSVLI
ncbi:hypothetical protein Hanom_Chr15g01341461 [Helianthus anomalus]